MKIHRKPPGSAGSKRPQRLLITAAVAIAAMLLLAVGVYAYDTAQRNEIAPGITIGGVEVGGRSADDAREVIEREIVAPLQRPVVVRFGNHRYKLAAGRLDRKVDVDGMLDQAVSLSRDGDLIDRFSRYARGSAVNAEIEPRVSYSEKAVDRFIAELREQIDRAPVNASIQPDGAALTPTPGKPGIALRAGSVRALISEEASSPGSLGEIEAEVKREAPEITTGELAERYPTYITVDRDNFKLRFFVDLELVKTYTIAVGAAGYDTPSGTYPIQSKQVNPTWYVPDSDWAGSLAGQTIPPGPQNPLKARWMGFYDGAGIHGTDDIDSLGTAASHGCIRMAIPEVIELFDRVEVGTPVYIE